MREKICCLTGSATAGTRPGYLVSFKTFGPKDNLWLPLQGTLSTPLMSLRNTTISRGTSLQPPYQTHNELQDTSLDLVIFGCQGTANNSEGRNATGQGTLAKQPKTVLKCFGNEIISFSQPGKSFQSTKPAKLGSSEGRRSGSSGKITRLWMSPSSCG